MILNNFEKNKRLKNNKKNNKKSMKINNNNKYIYKCMKITFKTKRKNIQYYIFIQTARER